MWYIGRKKSVRVSDISILERGTIYKVRNNILCAELIGVINGTRVCIEELPFMKITEEDMPKIRADTFNLTMSGKNHKAVVAAEGAITAFTKWLTGEEKPNTCFVSWEAFMIHLNNMKEIPHIKELLTLCQEVDA